MDFLTANDAPGAHPPSYYAATANGFPDLPALEGETRADVCVIGGGYAGLSAALHLAQAGLDVTLLDAHRVGWGASGRNGGQLGSGPRADIGKFEKTAGRDGARRHWDLAIEANRLVKDLIAEHGIACDLRPGYLECAHKPAHGPALREYALKLRDTCEYAPIRPVSREEMREMVATDAYHGGYYDGGAGHLHPLNYALGLAEAARKAGARLYERSTATSYAKTRVTTARGAVNADWVILACNGYLDGLERRVARRVMPINNFIIATEPLGGDGARALIRDDVAVCDSKFVLNYYRLSTDNRLLFGGGETCSRHFPGDIGSFVRRPMLEIFPQLRETRIDYSWGGTLAITATRYPNFQRVAPNVLAVCGWSGSGIHMATLGGKIAAEAVRGQMERFDVLEALPTPAFPGGDLTRSALLALAMSWYSLRDRL